jgi:hypothetical protein
MSGGSYDYLYCHVNGLEAQRGDIERMARRLEAGGYYAAARSTRDVLRMLDAAERIAHSLHDVWHAAEWVDSCDWGEDQLLEAVEKFSPWPPPEPGEAVPVAAQDSTGTEGQQ